MRRADRIIELAGCLKAKTVVRAEELASHLEVSVRTIYRDIATLQALGSGLVDQSQKMTVAASATAEKKAVGQRS